MKNVAVVTALTLIACSAQEASDLALTRAALDVEYHPTLSDDLIVDGVCSLREAFRAIHLRAAVDACPAGRGSLDYNNIHLPAGTLSATIGGVDEASLLGDFDVSANIRIYGATDGETIIDMNGLDRAFQSYAAFSLEIYDLTIREGCANGGTCSTDTGGIAVGGGILYAGTGTFKLVRSRIEGSRARLGGGLALYNSVSASNVVEDSEIVSNTASQSGGGVDASAVWTLRDSLVELNATTGGNATGAGIRQFERLATITGSTVRNNTSSGAGGGASAVGNFQAGSAGSLAISDSLFENNTANAGGGNLFANAGSGGTNLFSTPCAAAGCTITITSSSVVGGNGDQPAAPVSGSGGNLLANPSSAVPGRFVLRGNTAISMGIDASAPSAPDCQGSVTLHDQSSVANPTGCTIDDQRPVGPVCGNGIVEEGEDCEGSACCSACAFTTGACSDGNACTAGDACDGAGTCVAGSASACGDGVLQTTCGEQCDDGDTQPQDGCSTECKLEQCILWVELDGPPPSGGSGGTSGMGGSGGTGGSGGSSAGDCTWTDTVDVPAGFSCFQDPPVDQGPFGMRVALTFDDGPSTSTTPGILAELRARNIPATFFMVGQRLLTPEAAALAREIHLDPLFRVANHTYTHARLTDLDPSTAEQEIDLTSVEIRTALQDPCYFPRYFRFPQGRSDCATMQMVRARGFGVAGVSIDTLDWCYASTGTCPSASFPQIRPEHQSDMIAHAMAELAESGGGIVLMHDIHARTRDALPALLDQMVAAGVTFVALEDLAVFPQLNAQVHAPDPPACCEGVVH